MARRVHVVRDITAQEHKARQRSKRAAQVPAPSAVLAVTVKGIESEEDPDALATFAAEPHEGGWKARGTLARHGGRVVIRELTIEPTGEAAAQGVTRSLAREIPVASLHALAVGELKRRAFYVGERERIGAPPTPDARAIKRAATMSEAANSRARGGRPPLPDEHYRRIALTYLEILDAGTTRGILDEIARREWKLQRRTVPRETVRDWVQRATELGFLAGRVRGKAFAVPGPRLLAET